MEARVSSSRPRAAVLEPDRLDEAATAFALLASPMRLHIMWLLLAAESDVGGLAERTRASMPAVSQHLAKLKLAGLVRSRREGRRQVYLVDDPVMAAAVRLLLDPSQARFQPRASISAPAYPASTTASSA
ncbi:DNA-binding transcriptional ArsR family regulator [Streptacidiphilus sp. MAP12-20]|uniref:ArsR/SmtB family transcription factor n=1 Tax=Streptacidiphilus sp. MAP12-20 TaxID=3156299 RepID=UPI00351122F4